MREETVTVRRSHIKSSVELQRAVKMWQQLDSELVFEANGHLIRVSGPTEIFNGFTCFMRRLKKVDGRYLHFSMSETATIEEIAESLPEVFPGIDVAYIYGYTILVREGEQGDALLKALGKVTDFKA